MAKLYWKCRALFAVSIRSYVWESVFHCRLLPDVSPVSKPVSDFVTFRLSNYNIPAQKCDTKRERDRRSHLFSRLLKCGRAIVEDLRWYKHHDIEVYRGPGGEPECSFVVSFMLITVFLL